MRSGTSSLTITPCGVTSHISSLVDAAHCVVAFNPMHDPAKSVRGVGREREQGFELIEYVAGVVTGCFEQQQ